MMASLYNSIEDYDIKKINILGFLITSLKPYIYTK